MCYQLNIYLYIYILYNMSDSLGPGIRCKTISYLQFRYEKMKQIIFKYIQIIFKSNGSLPDNLHTHGST